jgi:hypothetical protein
MRTSQASVLCVRIRSRLTGLADEPDLTTQPPSRPAQRAESAHPEGKTAVQALLEQTPVEALVSVVRGRTGILLALDLGAAPGEGHLQDLAEAIALLEAVLAKPPPRSNCPKALLDEQWRSDLHRSTDDDNAIAGHQPADVVQNALPVPIGAVLQDFHAGDDVESLSFFQILDQPERQRRQVRKTLATLSSPDWIEISTHRLREQIGDESQEGSVPAPIVHQAATAEWCDEAPRHPEPAAMTPGNDAIATEELLPGVRPFAESVIVRPHSHRATIRARDVRNTDAETGESPTSRT